MAPSSKPDRKPSASPGMKSIFGPWGFGFRDSHTETLDKDQEIEFANQVNYNLNVYKLMLSCWSPDTAGFNAVQS